MIYNRNAVIILSETKTGTVLRNHVHTRFLERVEK